VDGAAADVHRGLGFVPELLDGEDAVNGGHVVEVPLEPGKPLVYVTSKGFRDVYVMARNGQLHDLAPLFRHPTNLLLLRSLDEGIFIASRYLATVRRDLVHTLHRDTQAIL